MFPYASTSTREMAHVWKRLEYSAIVRLPAIVGHSVQGDRGGSPSVDLISTANICRPPQMSGQTGVPKLVARRIKRITPGCTVFVRLYENWTPLKSLFLLAGLPGAALAGWDGVRVHPHICFGARRAAWLAITQ